MQAGISTASFFSRHQVEDTPARIAWCGASLCEIFLNTFSEYEEPLISLVVNAVKKSGLTVYSVHPMGTQFEAQLLSIHARQRTDALLVFERVLGCARRLGARYYVMHGPASMHGSVKNMEFGRIGPMVRELCEIAAGYGIEIAWENVSWCLYHWPGFAARILDAANTEKLKFTMDIKQAARSGYLPEEYIQALAALGPGRLVNLHVCDYYKGAGRVLPTMPGKGECDFRAVGAALAAMDYQGPAILEVYSDLYEGEDELRDSFLYMEAKLHERIKNKEG